MSLRHRMVTGGIKLILRLICRVDARELEAVPAQGPAIVVLNHINFLEVPMIYTFIHPRPQSSFIKAETLHNPLLAFIAQTWDAVPIRRSGVDTAAFAAAGRQLGEGRFFLLAPEGTRSGDGSLRRGKPGVVALAQRLRVPVIPVAHYGGEAFWSNFKRLRRTPFRFRVGRPYYIAAPPTGFSRTERQRVVDEVMMSLAELLPSNYRGVYAEGIGGEYRYLKYLKPADASRLLPAEGRDG